MPIDPNKVQWDETPQIKAEQVQWDKPPQKAGPTPEEKGPADYLESLWSGYKGAAGKALDILTTGHKKAAGMAVEAAAVPLSGIAGLAKTITSGPEAGAETIEQMQQFASEKAQQYLPAETAEKVIGKTIETGMSVPGVKPTIEAAMKVPEAIGDLTYEGALQLGLSPDTAAYFGAAGKSAIPVAVELLGIKGTKQAKKGLLKRVVKKAEKGEFYDEFGNLRPEMKTALKDADIGLEEVSDILPESITTQKSAVPVAEQIKTGKMAKIAETFQPDIEKIKAFEDLDMDYLPQYVSENPTAAAIAENLKDIPGSIMARKEKDIVEQLGKRADDIIIQGGGTVEKGELASRYITESNNIIEDLAQQSNELYNKVSKKIPPKTPATTEKIIEIINQRVDDLGGEKYLSAKERSILKALDSEANPTYGRLDMMRRQIGEQLGGIDTPFRNVDRKTLGELYDAMTSDQETSILRHGDQQLLETYLTGKYLTAQRKGIEKQLKNVLGKKLTGDITKKMGSAVKQLATGDFRTFDNLLNEIPTELGQDMRRELVTSALNDAFISGARSKGPISIGGFGNYWKKLNRNPKAKAKLKKELGSDTWERVKTLAKVNDALKSTMELSVKTGRQISTPGLFDESNKIASRMYGTAKKVGARTPVVGSLFGDVVNAPKNARSIAADELLSDRKFQNILRQKARAKTPKQIANMDKMIENIDTYKKWKKTLPPSDANQLAAAGALGYFTGRQKEEPQQ